MLSTELDARDAKMNIIFSPGLVGEKGLQAKDVRCAKIESYAKYFGAIGTMG